MPNATALLVSALALLAVACGGAVTVDPIVDTPIDPSPTPEPVPPPRKENIPGRGGNAVDPAPPVVTVDVDTTTLTASCDAAKTQLVDGNRWESTHHFANNGELAVALPGRWYACSPSNPFGAAGIALHQDGTSAALVLDGKTITEQDIGRPWSADPNPPRFDDGRSFLLGAEHAWAVISLDGKQAVMGKENGGSYETVFVRID